MKQKLSFQDLYGIRMLIFMEDEPQSNKYRQIILNKEKFTKVSLLVGEQTKEKMDDGTPIVELKLSSEVYELPDLMQTTNEY